MTDFLSPTNSRLMRVLLAGPERWGSQRLIAEAAEVAPPQVHSILHRLAFQGLVQIDKEGITVHRGLLQDFFVTLRRTRLFPVAEVSAERTAEELGADGKKAVLGLFTAANLHAPFEHRNTIDVIVPPAQGREFAAKLKDPKGTVTVRVFEDALKALETVRLPAGVVTSPLQTILDLKGLPQGGRFARFLASNAGLKGSLWR